MALHSCGPKMGRYLFASYDVDTLDLMTQTWVDRETRDLEKYTGAVDKGLMDKMVDKIGIPNFPLNLKKLSDLSWEQKLGIDKRRV